MRPLTFRSIVLATALGIVPMSALAATPQQALDQAIRSSFDAVPLWSAGEMTLNVSERPFVRTSPSTYGTAKVRMTQRTHSNDKANPLYEGRMALEVLDFHSSSQDAEIPMTLDGPVAVQWKVIGSKYFFRVEQLPDQLVLLFALISDMNPSALIGRWIEFEGKEGVENLTGQISPAVALSAGATDTVNTERLKRLDKLSIFLVRRVEKRTTGADGHRILRLRVALNPRVVAALLNEDIRAIAKTDPLRAEKLRTIYKRYADLRAVLARMQFVVEVDEVSQTFTRFEFGGRYVMPRKKCEFSGRTGRTVCPVRSNVIMHYTGGMSFAKDTGPAITAPSDAITVEQLVELLKPVEATSTQETPMFGDAMGTGTEAGMTQ